MLPLAADLLLLVPHLAAVLFALQKRPLLSGMAAGIGFLLNAKAVFVLAVCGLFAPPSLSMITTASLGSTASFRARLGSGPVWARILAGFLLPNLIAATWLAGSGAFTPWLDQAWRWPALYANSPLVPNPVWNGVVRTANWVGFHAVLALGALVFWWREKQWKFVVWAVLCYAGVVLGWRFFPRYFFLLLPPLTIAAARGLSLIRSRALAVVTVATLIVPLVRFGPRYASLTNWSDLAMDRDSRQASRLALSVAKPGDTLYVWGYRPEIFVYTRLKPATRYLDSQALTGVPADRHLTQSTVVLTTGTHEAREELARSKPDILIDGLSAFNPALSMDKYQELRPWLAGYRVAGRTNTTTVYTRCARQCDE